MSSKETKRKKNQAIFAEKLILTLLWSLERTEFTPVVCIDRGISENSMGRFPFSLFPSFSSFFWVYRAIGSLNLGLVALKIIVCFGKSLNLLLFEFWITLDINRWDACGCWSR